ncbi:MAG: hypothetical protein K8T90_05255 [Planctomycetes bacterium]|nr:hypothetical protein [Planctomycetota bacterium]
MARTARSWDPGWIHHVDARAHCGAPIFATDEDRAFVVARATRVFAEEGIVCLGWAVLVNHYHLLLRCPASPGHALLRLNTAIARRARLKGGGAGAVFQGRFFSALCTSDESLRRRLAYVTANAVHHRVVPSVAALRGYAWSSFDDVMGVRDAKLASPDDVLSVFHETDADQARRGFVELLEGRALAWAGRTGDPDLDDEDDADSDEPKLVVTRRVADETGMRRTVGAVLGASARPADDWDTVAGRRAALRAIGWRPTDLVAPVCALVGAEPADVRTGCRRSAPSQARAIVSHVAADHLAWPTNEVAAAVAATSSAVVQARPRGAALLAGLRVTAAEIVAVSRRR